MESQFNMSQLTFKFPFKTTYYENDFYVSSNNFEAYNNIKLLEKFLTQNGVDSADFDIFDFDKDILPKKKFDLITSIYSLDYHYDVICERHVVEAFYLTHLKYSFHLPLI